MAHHKIAFLADTHGLLREEVVQKIKDCEVIFHAGDFGGPEIVERLQQIAPVYMARGNNDKEWAKDMPYFVREQIGNRTFYMCHKKQDLPDDLGEVDFVICGHSHKYELKQEGSISDGMIPKLQNAFKALREGAVKVTIKHSSELLSDSGTVISL